MCDVQNYSYFVNTVRHIIFISDSAESSWVKGEKQHAFCEKLEEAGGEAYAFIQNNSLIHSIPSFVPVLDSALSDVILKHLFPISYLNT